MTEDFNPAERGEDLFSPDYWDGHSLKDDCPWTNREYKKIGALKIIKDVNRENDISRQAWDAISEFLNAAGSLVPTRTFRKGEVFDGSEHPLGTIVRLSEESAYEDDRGRPHLFKRRNYWGILAEGVEGPTLVRFFDYAFTSKHMAHWGLHGDPKREVGVVHHTRSRFPKNFPWSKHPMYQRVDRTNSLQIMGRGRAIRMPIPEDARGRVLERQPARI